MFTFHRKSGSLNPFPMTDFRPEVELMHLLRMRRYYRHKLTENGVACRILQRLYGKTGTLNSNIKSDFKLEAEIWLKLRMRSEKSPKLAKRCVGSDGYNFCVMQEIGVLFAVANVSPEIVPVTHLRPDVELMYLLRLPTHCHV